MERSNDGNPTAMEWRLRGGEEKAYQILSGAVSCLGKGPWLARMISLMLQIILIRRKDHKMELLHGN